MSDSPSAEQLAARHRALSDTSRLAILRALERENSAVDVTALAERVGLHVNTVRWHLAILTRAGLVHEERVATSGRGRPPHAYRIGDGALDDQPGGYRLLAEVLVASLAARRDGPALVEAAGRARGRALAAPTGGGASTAKEATAQLMRVLELLGFRPELKRERGGRRIQMRPCPFGETAADHPEIVCPLHLGLIRGVLEALGAPIEAAAVEPFARPDLCLAHLRPRGPAAP